MQEKDVPKHEKCDDCIDDAVCEFCGGYLHHNYACGDPECCGESYNYYCRDCGAEEGA